MSVLPITSAAGDRSALPLARSPEGGAHFIAAARHAELCADLRRGRYLVVAVAPPERGRLRLAIDDAVEGALAMRGALPAATPPDASLETTLRDQIFRARALGATGLAVALPELRTAGTNLLDLEDGVTLATLLHAARRAPILLVLDDRDRDLGVMRPVSLGDLAGPSPLRESAPPASGEVPTIVELRNDPSRDERAIAAPPAGSATMARKGVMKKRSLRLDSALVEPAHAPEVPLFLQEAPASVTPLVPPVVTTPVSRVLVEEVVEAPPPPAPVRAHARRVIEAAEWRQHALELDRARGPKPVAVIERLFATRYMPLLGALAHGEADAAVRGVVDAWRQTFEHSYREAFAAIRVTGKRPPMVFDAPEIAARLARLNGARGVKLVLVDAMRFDVGELLADKLKEGLGGAAVCIERGLLWSALPTTTPTQIALLSRGPEGLRDGEPTSEPEPEIVRGRAVGTLRRDRVGSREIMKLDLVEARLRNAGAPHDDRIDALAEEVAPIVGKYIESMPPRTLVYVFGDHGFRLPASPDGRATGPASQGGVSPEEVLVPAQAWLVGGVH
jgi:hypothetical protein